MCFVCRTAGSSALFCGDAEEARPFVDPSLAPADVILHNARVLTLDAERPVAEALSIREGLIHSIGSSDEILRRKGRMTRLIDLGGCCVVPGFIGTQLPRDPTDLFDTTAPDPTGPAGGGAEQSAAKGTASPSSRELMRMIERAIARAAAAGFTMVRDERLGGLGGRAELAAVEACIGRRRRLRIRGVPDVRLRAEGGDTIEPGFGDDMFCLAAASIELPSVGGFAATTEEMFALLDRGWQVDLAVSRGEGFDEALALAAAVARRGQTGLGLVVAAATPDAERRRELAAAGFLLECRDHRTTAGETPEFACSEELLDLTIRPAERYGVSAIAGSLEVGKYADLTLLAAPPRGGAPVQRPGNVIGTWVEGIPVSL